MVTRRQFVQAVSAGSLAAILGRAGKGAATASRASLGDTAYVQYIIDHGMALPIGTYHLTETIHMRGHGWEMADSTFIIEHDGAGLQSKGPDFADFAPGARVERCVVRRHPDYPYGYVWFWLG